MNQIIIAGGIFLLTYVVIVSERLDRTIAALLGGFLMIMVGILDQEEAFHAVDFNVIFLLIGMMVIANILSETGVFQWIAIKAIQFGNRNPFRILAILAVVTAVLSAFLDNVTVVVLLAPVTLFVANNLRLNPIPFLIAEVLASNIGGTATLIGDPPNILIGSAAGIDFVTFAANMSPVIIIIMIVFIPLSYLIFRKDLNSSAVSASGPMEELAAENLITDPKLLRKSLIVIGGVLLGFLLHSVIHLEVATVAMVGAAILLAWSGQEVHHALRHVEWNSLLFFVGLFITVEGIVKANIIEMLATEALALTQGNLALTTYLVLWLSAVVSAIVDNIPYAATVIPLVKSLGARGVPTETLWWALALGADLGGNFTIVGASANVVVANFAARSGHKITFGQFFKYSFFISIAALTISTVYLWLRYL